MEVKQILTGHVSPETAYVVADYPYGFTLRCQIRYWLEYKKNKGVRLVSQTSNPKHQGLVWNKEKASTYARFGGCMFLDEKNYVQWSALTEYTTADEIEAWVSQFNSGNPASELASKWHTAKVLYEARPVDLIS